MNAAMSRFCTLFVGMLTVCGAAAAYLPPALPFQLESPAAELGKIRSLAESQHEIVMIHIRKKDFAAALQEAGKIFEMKWPQDQEPLLIREIRYLSEQLVNNEQLASALQLLDANVKHFRGSGSRAAIWKEKGYVLKKMGQDEKALEAFREAQRLEKGP